MIKWLTRRYDWFIYCTFQGSYDRMCRSQPGWAWPMKFFVEDWLARHDPTSEHESAARAFYETQRKAGKTP